MDLIYMNDSMEDVGVLHGYEFDLAFGKDENSFECSIQAAHHCCKTGWYLYIEGTEYGGIIDAITSDTGTGEVIYSGRTWHGILNSKVLEPDAGENYLVVSGSETHAAIMALVERMELDALFTVPEAQSGVEISSYQMPRYIAGYDGITKMLGSVECRLQLAFDGGKVVLSAVPKVDYTGEEFDSDKASFSVKQAQGLVNHLICLGGGELAERLVVHLYADSNGSFGTSPFMFGLDEYTAVFDYPNVESEQELITAGIERFRELRAVDAIRIDLDADGDEYHVGDRIGAVDNVTGITATAEIAKKIVTIKDGRTTISYEVGD